LKKGSLGPQPYWLQMSVAERARTKQYIKESLQGYRRADGIDVPGLRKIYSGFTADNGFDLRHIERWPSSKMKSARKYIAQLNTLTGRSFQVLTPRTAKQKKAAKIFTGQDLQRQKKMIVAVQDAKHDTPKFKNNQVVIERKFPSGTKQIEQRYLFRDYNNGIQPITFIEMRRVTKTMLPDMPERYRGGWVYYTLLTVQYGSIGQSVPKKNIMDLLAEYHARYEKATQHQGFAETVIGYNMVGSDGQAMKYQIEREHQIRKRKQLKRLRFSRPRGRL
jgi:hypothetical protein